MRQRTSTPRAKESNALDESRRACLRACAKVAPDSPGTAPEERLAVVVSDAVNNLGFKPEVFADAMSRDHRTLQASFSRLCFAWLRRLAKQAEAHEYDLRNEKPVLTAKKIVEAFGDDLYVPLI